MVTYHYVKMHVSIIIQLEVININVRNFKRPIGFYSNPHPFEPQKYGFVLLYHKSETLGSTRNIYQNSTKFHEILSCSSWDLLWTSSSCTERKENNKNKKNNNNNNNKIWL